jgi:hypothetical protein
MHQQMRWSVVAVCLAVTGVATADGPRRSVTAPVATRTIIGVAKSAITAENDTLTAPDGVRAHMDVAADAEAENGMLAIPLERRAALREHGLMYASYQTTFGDESVSVNDGDATVRITEATSLVNQYVDGSTADLPVTEYAREHVVALVKVDGRWRAKSDALLQAFAPSTADDVPEVASLRPLSLDASPQGATSLSMVPRATGAYRLNRSAIVTYAVAWVGKDLHQFSTRGYNPTYAPATFLNDDCTDFISQALYAGGWTFKQGLKWIHNYWWFEFVWPHLYTDTWTQARSWADFVQLSGRGSMAGYVSDLQLGDILQFGTQNDGSIGHSMIVTKRDSFGNVWLTYHSVNELNRPFWDLYTEQKKIYPRITFYGWRLQDSFN